MVSGLPQHIINMRPEDSAATFVDSVQYLKTNVQLRTQFQYSNANYVILGRIAELLLNQTLESYIQSKIFRPLGMNGLFSAQAAGNTGRRTQGFALQGGNAARCAELISSGGNPLDPSCFGSPKAFNFWTDGTGVEFGGGGYIILTPNDMVCTWNLREKHADWIYISSNGLVNSQIPPCSPLPLRNGCRTARTSPLLQLATLAH